MSVSWTGQRVASTALIVLLAGVSVWMLWRFLPALAWGAVLAIATWPLLEALRRRGTGRTAAASLLTLATALVLVLPLVAFAIEAARESGAAMEWLRDVRQNGLGTPGWLRSVPYVGPALAAWWQVNVAPPGAAQSLLGRSGSDGMFSLTRTLGVEFIHRVTILVFTLLTLFFLYRDGDRFAGQAQSVGARLFGSAGKQLGKNAIAAVRGTVNGLVLVGLGEGVLLGIAYAATGLPHAVLLGLLTAVLAAIPFGAPLVFVLCALALLIQAKTSAAVALLIVGSLVAFVADHFVRPLLIGNSTRLPFLWVLLGIFGGLESFGLIGLFLGPAIISVLVEIWRETAE